MPSCRRRRTLTAAALLAGLILICADGREASAQNQWDALYDRILRLEHAVGALQAQGGQPQQLHGAERTNPASLAELSLRVDNVEAQLRQIVGQLQEIAFRMEQVGDRLNRFSEDVEFRFQELGQGGRRDRSGNAAPMTREPAAEPRFAATQPTTLHPAPVSSAPLQLAPRHIMPGNPDRQPDTGGDDLARADLDRFAAYIAEDGAVTDDLNKAPPPSTLGTLPLSALGGEETQTAALPGEVVSRPLDGGTGSIGGGVEALYERSYENLLRRRFGEAERGFMSIIRDHPDHQLAGNAQYWLGETYYVRGEFKDAAEAFLKAYRDYNKGPKAPDSLLKLGMTLSQLGQKDQACASFGQLSQEFPGASDAIRQRAAAERKRTGC